MCGLAMNIASFAHFIEKGRLWCCGRSFTITHIMGSKMEPNTNRIKWLLEILSSYSFNYKKGKDIVLSDFLSRQPGDDRHLHEIIPISFNLKEVLKQSNKSMVEDTYKVQTRSQSRGKASAPTVQNTMGGPILQNTHQKIPQHLSNWKGYKTTTKYNS